MSESYDSDDSEYNLISGHVNISDNEVQDHGNLGDNNGMTGLLPSMCSSHLELCSNEYIP